jgi:hypothetical protein
MASASIEPVWGYRVELDGAPIYFGIGQEGRWKHVTSGRSHNHVLRGLARDKAHRLAVIPTDRPFDSRADAQQWERDMIAFFGRWDRGLGRLVNHTDGGDGVSSDDMRREHARRRANGWTVPEHARRRTSEYQKAQAAAGIHPLQNPAVRAATSQRMKRVAAERSRQLLESGRHHFLDPEFQERMKPIKLAALHCSTLERREAGTLGTQRVRPWHQLTATDATRDAWAQTPVIIAMVNAGTSLAGVARTLNLQCSIKPLQNIMRKARTGWVPEQDLDWREWARAYRASNPTGEHTHGTDPSGP